MAQRVQVILEDDVDGSNADQTVQFAIDGAAYEIDLNEQHATQLREAFSTWVGAARKTSGPARKRGATGRGPSGPRLDSATRDKMREWGRANGHQVGVRGRFSQELIDAYQQAH